MRYIEKKIEEILIAELSKKNEEKEQYTFINIAKKYLLYKKKKGENNTTQPKSTNLYLAYSQDHEQDLQSY